MRVVGINLRPGLTPDSSKASTRALCALINRFLIIESSSERINLLKVALVADREDAEVSSLIERLLNEPGVDNLFIRT